MSPGNRGGEEGGAARNLTVARVRDRPDHVQVAFLESARFYKLPKLHPNFAALLGLLTDARDKSRVLKVSLSSPQGDVIEDVQEP
jgi:hypothetical protein